MNNNNNLMHKTALKVVTVVAAVTALGLGSSLCAQAEIAVGVAGPITGPYAVFGEQMTNGVQQAVIDLNEHGGVLGEKVVYKVGDDACDPRQAVAVANQMATDGITFVSGHFCSGSSIPASDVYEEEGIIMMTPASTNPQLTEQGKWNVFRVVGRDDQQGKVAGDFLAKEFPDARIAIAHDRQTYSAGLAEETRKALNAHGIKEVLYETVTPGERDYSAFVTRLKQANADILYYGGYHTEAGLIVRQMRDQGMDTVLMSGDAIFSNEFWAVAGEGAEGTLMTFAPDPALDPDNADIVAAFKRKNYRPEGFTLYAYATIQLWAQAIKAVGSADPDKIADYLKSHQIDTVLGNITFDEKGDVVAPGYVVYRWSNGNYDYYQDSSQD